MNYNVIAVFSQDARQVLMCKRRKEPYRGLLNFVGGKIEPNEPHSDAAYRELWEETSIARDDIALTHVMTLAYPLEDWLLEVYTGRMRQLKEARGDENELVWVDADADFSDLSRFAGIGNLYHIMRYIQSHRETLWR